MRRRARAFLMGFNLITAKRMAIVAQIGRKRYQNLNPRCHLAKLR